MGVTTAEETPTKEDPGRSHFGGELLRLIVIMMILMIMMMIIGMMMTTADPGARLRVGWKDFTTDEFPFPAFLLKLSHSCQGRNSLLR